jgi:hypothetical protein
MTDLPLLPPEPTAPPATLLPSTVQHGRAWKATRRAPWIATATELPHHRLHDTRAPSWLVSPRQINAAPALDFTAWARPVLAVLCPVCRKHPGQWCVRSSGHRAMDLYPARRTTADRAFMKQRGPEASIGLVDGRWLTGPLARAVPASPVSPPESATLGDAGHGDHAQDHQPVSA